MKWNKWIDIIHKEITSLSIYRHIFWEVQKIIKNNKKIQKPSSFYEYLSNTYSISAVMGIRRQVKIDKHSISFAKLLKQMSGSPKILSRERYVSLYGEDKRSRKMGEEHFKKFADKSGCYVNPNMIKDDSKMLKEKAKKCEKYADMRVAHFDKRTLKNVLTFKNIDDCIDFMEELFRKYYLILRADYLSSVLPTWQYDWKDIFAEPWIPKPTLYENYY